MTQPAVKPWYRQFWPWFLISLPASAVIAGLYTAFLAVRTDDSLVVDSDEGMDVVAERHLAAERLAAELGLEAHIRIDAGTGAVVATLTSPAHVDWPDTLRLQFSHPTLAVHDQSVALVAALPDSDGNAVWAGRVHSVPDGRWYLVLDDDAWRLSGTWRGEPDLRLRPGGDGND